MKTFEVELTAKMPIQIKSHKKNDSILHNILCGIGLAAFLFMMYALVVIFLCLPGGAL